MQPLNILLVEDDDDDAELLAFALGQVAGRDYQVRRATSLAQFQECLSHARPDIVLLDLNLPDSLGLETVSQAVAAAQGVPILVLTGNAANDVGVQAIERGAQDFIPKEEILSPLLVRSMDFTVQRAQIANAAAARALIDSLTGLGNRTALNRQLEASIGHCRRHGGGFAIAFIDLDGFKAINDSRGHAAGDVVLNSVGKRCQEIARAGDFPCRLGGDEFVILLDGIGSLGDARMAMARYVHAIERPVPLQDGGQDQVAVGASVGLAIYPLDGKSAQDLMAAADSRMYAAKSDRKRGRRTGS